MSLITSYTKAKKALKKLEENEINSYEEVLKILGDDNDFYKLWAKNIFEYKTTEMPSSDLKFRFPNRIPNKKDYNVLCSAAKEVFVVNTYTFEEAVSYVKHYLKDDGSLNYEYKLLDDNFKRKCIYLK